MDWFALFTIKNPYFDPQQIMISTIYSSQKKLLNDLSSQLCALTGYFQHVRPHPDDVYQLSPMCIKDKQVCDLKGKPLSLGGHYVFEFHASKIFNWSIPIEQAREVLKPTRTKDEERLRTRLQAIFHRLYLDEKSDFYPFQHIEIPRHIVGLLKVGLPALIDDMKQDEEERRNLFAGANKCEVVEQEKSDAAAE